MDNKTEKETDELMKILGSADDITELEEYMDSIDGKYDEDFPHFIDKALKNRGFTPAVLQKKALIDRTYIYQILDGTRRPGRDKVISVCVALELQLPDIQRALKLAGYSLLYPKNRRDSIIIYGINNGESIVGINDLLHRYDETILQ